MIEIDTQTQLPLPAILARLSSTDLRPSLTVNHLFSQLVATSLSDVRSSLEQRALARTLASTGEYELEKHWAQRVLDGDSIENFPYIENYLELAHHEYGALMQYIDQAKEWAFVGSGPLPLSQLLFEMLHGGSHTYIERDPTAHVHGEKVAALLGADVMRQHILADASEYDYTKQDIVLLAALVGNNENEKQNIMQTIVDRMRPGALLAARSVPDDGRTLLYPRLGSLPSGVTFLEETTPPEGVINSLVIMRVNGRG